MNIKEYNRLDVSASLGIYHESLSLPDRNNCFGMVSEVGHA